MGTASSPLGAHLPQEGEKAKQFCPTSFETNVYKEPTFCWMFMPSACSPRVGLQGSETSSGSRSPANGGRLENRVQESRQLPGVGRGTVGRKWEGKDLPVPHFGSVCVPLFKTQSEGSQ